MENIYEATADFPFDKLTLLKPSAMAGGNYFMKFRIQDSPLYIQSPKCLLKQGISKAGKRFYSDLMFSNEHESFTQWIERLENFSQKYIYEQRTQWFETDLDMHDIENSFTPSLKLYKSGKYYLARANIPSILGKCSLKIYDEKENEIDHEQLAENMNVITILEILGIKCSARSFQIEIEIKQMLVLKPVNLFDKCILVKTPTSLMDAIDLGKTMDEEPPATIFAETPINENVVNGISENVVKGFSENVVNGFSENVVNGFSENVVKGFSENVVKGISENVVNGISENNPQEYLAEPSLEERENPVEERFSETISHEYPIEVDFPLAELSESDSIQLKTRNDVYYKMYRDAKRKAKIARDLALSSYLEAKRIKNIYMLNEIDDSDSDLEEEEEEFEESMHSESAI